MTRFVYINDDSCRNSYCDNRISNTKYTLWNFLPKNLWEQFRRFMNQYFLLIACLQLWSLITPVSPATTWGPLIIIFTVSASKEAWDDYNRYLSDKKANERKVSVVKEGLHKQKQKVCKLSFSAYPYAYASSFMNEGYISGKCRLYVGNLETVENIVFDFLQKVFPNIARLGVPTSNSCNIQFPQIATFQNNAHSSSKHLLQQILKTKSIFTRCLVNFHYFQRTWFT